MMIKRSGEVAGKALQIIGSFTLLVIMASAWVAGAPALAAQGDSARGEEALRSSGCGRCHALGETGGGTAPDLARRTARDYAPTSVAAVIWNHEAAAWAHPDGESADARAEGEAADVFAYFCSRRYFDSFGSAKRGKEFFEDSGCAGCHGGAAALSGSAPEAARWEFLRDPIAEAQWIWNGSVAMRKAAAERKDVHLPQVTAQELNDLFLYLENLPRNRGQEPHFSLASAEEGHAVFNNKGCAKCHQAAPVIENRSARFTLTDVAAALWRHDLRRVENRQPFSYDEMSGVVAYLWAANTCGAPARGQRVFETAGCTSCHDGAGTANRSAPAQIAEDGDVSTSIVGLLWEHGPTMRAQMQKNGIAWPRLDGKEMADLGAFLRTAFGQEKP